MSKDALNPAGYQKLTVSTAAVGLAIPARAVRAQITVENDSIRYRDDGTAPDSSNGVLMVPTQTFTLDSSQSLAQFKAIRDANASSDVTLDIVYYQLH